MHASLNGSALLGLTYVGGGNDLLNGPAGLAGCLVLATMNAGLYAFARPQEDQELSD